MPRRVLCFLDGLQRDHSARAAVTWAAFLVEHAGFKACMFLCGASGAPVDTPKPLQSAQWFAFADMPPLEQMAAADLAALSGALHERYPADVVLVPGFLAFSQLHLLGAFLAARQSSPFLYGVAQCIPLQNGGFACRRALAGRILEETPAFPVVMAVTHDAGLPAWPHVSVPPAEKLTPSGLGMDVKMLQMRTAVFPEPVSILHTPEIASISLDHALSLLFPENL